MLIVLALLFPLVLMGFALVMSSVEGRLDRALFGLDVRRLVRDTTAGEHVETAIADHAQVLMTRARRQAAR